MRYRKAMRVKALNLLELAIQSSPNFKQGSQSPIVVTDDNVIAVAGAQAWYATTNRVMAIMT